MISTPKDYPEIMDKSPACKEKSKLFKNSLYSWCRGLDEERKERDQRAREAGH